MKSVRDAVNFFRSSKVDEQNKNREYSLWPSRCLACGDVGSFWQQQSIDCCTACLRHLPWLENGCLRCAEPISEQSVCGRCLKDPPAIQRSWVPLRYEAPMTQWLPQFKYRAQLKYGRLLSQLLARTLSEGNAPMPQLIIPVPMHPQKLGQRGFNQALLVAKDLSRRFGIPYSNRHLIRRQSSPAQAGLKLAARQRNLRHAFAVQAAPPQRIALVDDVITTGSTIRACARTLEKAGAQHIEVWALARTP